MSEPEVFAIKPIGKEIANNENYQMVNLLRRLDVSEQKPEPISDAEALAALAAPPRDLKPPRELKPRALRLREPRLPAEAAPESAPAAVTIPSPKLAPEQGAAATGEASKATPKEISKETIKEIPKEIGKETAKEALKETLKAEAVKADAPRLTSRLAAAFSSRTDDPNDDASEDGYDDSWTDESASLNGKRRITALAAVIGLAVVSGAIGGALATAHFGNHPAPPAAGEIRSARGAANNQAVEDSLARIDTELASIKELNAAQSNQVNERIDRLEKAQAEPAAKLARLNETVERLRAAPSAFASANTPKDIAPKDIASPPAPAVAPVASVATARETTAAIQPPAAALAGKPKPKTEIGKLTSIDGWVLRDVNNGGAVIEGKQGLFEVVAGDTMPGLGRVEAIRRQDGRWVVVTTKGTIFGR